MDIRKQEGHYSISYCITCMGRLHQLEQTLPRNIEDNRDYPSCQFVILDYNSPDGLEEWIHNAMGRHLESGIIKYVKFCGPAVFHHSHAKNLAHRAADGDILCNLDADNFTCKGFSHWINAKMQEDGMTIGRRTSNRIDKRGTEGRVFLHRYWFDRLGGYDEAFFGWSLEDTDLVARGRAAGLRICEIPEAYLDCLAHSHSERRQFTPMSIRRSVRRNHRLFQHKRNCEYQMAGADNGCVFSEEGVEEIWGWTF